MNTFTWKTVFKYRNTIYGLSAIWIVFYHIHQRYTLGIPVASPVISLGNMGVDIFLLLSAIGLSFSVERNTVVTFYENRLKRTYLTYLLIAGPFIFWKYFFVQDITSMTVPGFFAELSTVSYFWTKEGTFPFWYVPCILLFYALYPVLYKLYKKNKLYIVGLIVVSIITEIVLLSAKSTVITTTERTFSRIPIFLIGILLSDFVKNEKGIGMPYVIASTVLVVITMIIFPITQLKSLGVHTIFIRYFYGIMAICLIVSIAYVLECIKNFSVTEKFTKICSFFGGISLEIYLVHVAIIRTLTICNLQHLVHWCYYYVGVLISAIVLAFCFSKLSNNILNKKSGGK